MLPTYSIPQALLAFTIIGCFMACFVLAFSWAVRPLKQRPKAQEPYECGMPASGSSRGVGFNFIVYATLFLVFDVAAVYLFLFTTISNPSRTVLWSMIASLCTLGLIILITAQRKRYHVA